MADLCIVTNNDSVDAIFKQYKKNARNSPEVRFIEAAASRVLQTAREAAHKGAQLLNIPLSAASPHGENPFLTLFMTVPEENCVVLHFQSVALIEEALRVYAKAGKNRFRAYKDDILAEYKKADLEMAMLTVKNLAELLSKGF